MPYIPPDPNRELIDSHLTDELFNVIGDVGDLNYVVTRLALRLLLKRGLRYENVSNITGTLRLVPNEMERRFLGEYEDIKMIENGDVPEYQIILKQLRELQRKTYDHAPDTQQAHG